MVGLLGFVVSWRVQPRIDPITLAVCQLGSGRFGGPVRQHVVGCERGMVQVDHFEDILTATGDVQHDHRSNAYIIRLFGFRNIRLSQNSDVSRCILPEDVL